MGIKLVSLLSQPQQAVEKEVSSELLSGLKGWQPYAGSLFTETPQSALDVLAAYNKSGETAISFDEINNQLRSMMSGKPAFKWDYEASSKFFKENMATPAAEIFRSEIQPIIEEQFGGNFFGSSRRKEVQRSAVALGRSLQEQMNAINTIGLQLEAASAEAGADRAVTAAQLASTLPELVLQSRMSGALAGANLEQQQKLAKYEEWQVQNQVNPFLTLGEAFVQNPTMEAIVKSGSKKSGFGSLLGAAAGVGMSALFPGLGLSAVEGGLLGAVGGSAF